MDDFFRQAIRIVCYCRSPRVDEYAAKTQIVSNGSHDQGLTRAPSEHEIELISPVAPKPEADCGCSGKSPQPLDTGKSLYVYAIGKIEPRFPSLSIEREFSQVRAIERHATAGKTDRETLYLVLSKYKYLARRMCYVL